METGHNSGKTTSSFSPSLILCGLRNKSTNVLPSVLSAFKLRFFLIFSSTISQYHHKSFPQTFPPQLSTPQRMSLLEYRSRGSGRSTWPQNWENPRVPEHPFAWVRRISRKLHRSPKSGGQFWLRRVGSGAWKTYVLFPYLSEPLQPKENTTIRACGYVQSYENIRNFGKWLKGQRVRFFDVLNECGFFFTAVNHSVFFPAV